LVAAGRVANTLGLGLESSDVTVDGRGFIVVDDFLDTSVSNIRPQSPWFPSQFTYISLDDYRIIRDQFDGNKKRPHTAKDNLHAPYSTFILPTLSRIGLSEEETLPAGTEIQVIKILRQQSHAHSSCTKQKVY
jgi:pyruvate/2-oxoglutarate dehydrogenase complex dihydrolipoamide dehydrogenase (E3) component